MHCKTAHGDNKAKCFWNVNFSSNFSQVVYKSTAPQQPILDV